MVKQITDYVNEILTEKRLKNMRDAIAQGILQTYEDATKEGNANMEVSLARKHFKDLASRLDASDDKLFSTSAEVEGARAGKATLGQRLDETTAQLAQAETEAFRKRELEDLSPEVISAIEGGAGTSFNLLSIPQNGSVTHEKMAFTAVDGEKSVNVFDKRKARLNKNMTSAGLVDNAGTYVSDFISVIPGSNMIFNNFNDPTAVYFYSNTGTEKDYLSFINITYIEGKFTVPTGVTRLIFRSRMSNINTAQLQYGNTTTDYEPFGGLLSSEYIKDRSIPLEKVDGLGKITPEYLSFVETSPMKGAEKNIKDSYSFTENEVVNTTTGLFESSVHYLTAKNIPVTGYDSIFIYRSDSAPESTTYYPLVLYNADNSVHTGYSQMVRPPSSYDDKLGWLIPIPTGVTTASISSATTHHDNVTYLLTKLTEGISIKNLILPNEQTNSKHQGKKAGFLGDSIVEYEPYFFGKIKDALGLTDLIDYGYGGSSYALRNSTTWDPVTITKRSKEMDPDLDIIFLLGGTNDFATASVLGTMEDRTEATFYGALHETLSGLVEKYPLASIYLLTMPPRRVQLEPNTQGEYISQYVNAFKEVGAFYSVPVLDILSNSQMRPWNTTNNAYYYKAADGLHPNERGYDVILNDMLPWVERS